MDSSPKWETNTDLKLMRLEVPGGWLVQPVYGEGLAFVPKEYVDGPEGLVNITWEW